MVQNYNWVLTLAHLQQLSDALLVHQNDTLHQICAGLLHLKHISFSHLNRVVAQQLAGVLQPALTPASFGAYGRNPLGGDWSSSVPSALCLVLLRTCCVSPPLR